MKNNQILAKVYSFSSIISFLIMLILCLIFRWDLKMILVTTAASLVIGAPSVISLNALCWLSRKIRFTPGFAWMVMMALIPLLLIIPSLVLEKALPGDAEVLILIGILSSYAGLLGHGISIAQLFKSYL